MGKTILIISVYQNNSFTEYMRTEQLRFLSHLQLQAAVLIWGNDICDVSL